MIPKPGGINGDCGATMAAAGYWRRGCARLGGWSGHRRRVSGIWTMTPPSWREGIYSWTEDGFIVLGDIGENVGDWFVDRWMDLTGGVPL